MYAIYIICTLYSIYLTKSKLNKTFYYLLFIIYYYLLIIYYLNFLFGVFLLIIIIKIKIKIRSTLNYNVKYLWNELKINWGKLINE